MITQGPEARRSARVLLSLPIELQGDGRAVRAHTVVVNRHGAMVLCPLPYRADQLLRIRDLSRGETALCRVVWCGGEDLPGLFKLGIEIGAVDFWGRAYDAAVTPAIAPGLAR